MINSNNQKLFRCQCGSHAVGASIYPDLGDSIYVEWWTVHEEGQGFFRRLKAAWYMLRKGSYLTHDVIINSNQATDLGNFLIEASEKARNSAAEWEKECAEEDLKSAYKLEDDWQSPKE